MNNTKRYDKRIKCEEYIKLPYIEYFYLNYSLCKACYHYCHASIMIHRGPYIICRDCNAVFENG